ncbi:hypothetical protein LPJ78_001833 [Coemansia sp. RSA 989]|nr:hypothetical protein LPJ68_001834 [Coemansia sp. RSA 1086]KAJ1751214.1 hypothetical protein LPJ79_002245 [Coemansia sp. RSA 1821]KAJ1866472.1 hypothetical protein LPJ78_001833 [Coemansia sp. RSA 989]KAJ1874124.1 hypothetical protein LPJ55_001724 [Coemansia sp. RSA 990]KAJ2670685.1 hypothetical protein IWW42_003863 [Coemansia sp. RSA 1085]
MEFERQVYYLSRRYYLLRAKRSDWELIAHILRVPLLKCLEAFDHDKARVMPRHIPEHEEWRLEDIAALKNFTERYFKGKMTIQDWVLAGKYMNISHSNCIAKMWALDAFQMTPQLYAKITEFRHAGLLWPTIFAKVNPQCTLDILRFAYSTTSKEQVQKIRRPKAKFRISKHQHWTAEEDQRLLQLLGRFDDGRDIDWNFISKTIGHSKNACRYRRILLSRSQRSREPQQCPSPDTDTSDKNTPCIAPRLVN